MDKTLLLASFILFFSLPLIKLVGNAIVSILNSIDKAKAENEKQRQINLKIMREDQKRIVALNEEHKRASEGMNYNESHDLYLKMKYLSDQNFKADSIAYKKFVTDSFLVR